MGYRLTPEERRIIERTKREGEQYHADTNPDEHRDRDWATVLILFGTFLFMAALATGVLYFMEVF